MSSTRNCWCCKLRSVSSLKCILISATLVLLSRLGKQCIHPNRCAYRIPGQTYMIWTSCHTGPSASPRGPLRGTRSTIEASGPGRQLLPVQIPNFITGWRLNKTLPLSTPLPCCRTGTIWLAALYRLHSIRMDENCRGPSISIHSLGQDGFSDAKGHSHSSRIRCFKTPLSSQGALGKQKNWFCQRLACISPHPGPPLTAGESACSS